MDTVFCQFSGYICEACITGLIMCHFVSKRLCHWTVWIFIKDSSVLLVYTAQRDYCMDAVCLLTCEIMLYNTKVYQIFFGLFITLFNETSNMDSQMSRYHAVFKWWWKSTWRMLKECLSCMTMCNVPWLYEQVISNERRYSHDSDSDEDVPDELRADYVDERTGDAPPPQKKYVATRCLWLWWHCTWKSCITLSIDNNSNNKRPKTLVKMAFHKVSVLWNDS